MTNEYRLYGPPGTGKTTWIATKAKEYAEKYGGDQVSLCSLTNAAIKEVVSRDIPIPRGNVTTLHSRCKRALFAGKPAERDVRLFMEENKAWSNMSGSIPCLPPSMLRAVKKDSTTDEVALSGGSMSLFESAQILRQQMIPKDRWPKLTKDFSVVWEGWCAETGRMDFTGWLEEALKSNPLPPQQVVLVDEAQDHTPLQLAVIRAWETKQIILVGDDDQCCYEWSGSVPDEFVKKTANLKKEKTLSQSYRVPRKVHAIADRLVHRIKSRKEKEYHPRDFEGHVEHLNYSLSDAYGGYLPKQIEERPDESHMLIASCAYMLKPIIDCLKSYRIPFHNPYRPSQVTWNPLRAFNRCVNTYEISDRLWTGSEAMVWADLLRAKGVFQPKMKQRFMNLCSSLDREILTEDDIRKYFLPESADRVLKMDVRFLKEEKSNMAGGNWDYAWDIYKTGKSITPNIVVGTIHSVKGGEADNVYLFPDLSSSGLNEYLGTRADRIYRLFYVGVTRARKNLYLCTQDQPLRAIGWR